ncbi:MAG TPA: hypothetical protein VKY24_06550 [Reyranella sp.]|nr:hypothetical protein [Reyranella sp.]
MTNALPAAFAVLTALITTGLVHAGYAILWLAHTLTGRPTTFDWTEALTVSVAASGVVLIIALVVWRLVGGNAPTHFDPAPRERSATCSPPPQPQRPPLK